MSYTLVPFAPCPFVETFTADFGVSDHVECEWRLDGNMDAIRWPSTSESRRRITGLWETTCFEWFYGPVDGPGYTEFNLSPSHDWNAFEFTALRQGRVEATRVQPLSISFHHTSREALLHVRVAGEFLAPPCHLGLCAVIEDLEGQLHYFALAHTTPSPDFHEPGNHVRLDGPGS